MSKSSRYFLIALGVLAFFILAPLVVIYALGLKYDQEAGRFLKTGILALRIDPSVADVSLNGRVIKKSAADIKFLSPGEYQILIEKPGYFPWSKRLLVSENQVTWGNTEAEKIFLLLNSGSPELLGENVSDFFSDESKTVALAANQFWIFPRGVFTKPESFDLKGSYTQLTASADGNYFLARSESEDLLPKVIDIRSKKIFDLTGLKKDDAFVFADQGRLFANTAGEAYEIDYRAGTRKKIATGISALTAQGPDLYFLRTSATSSQISAASLEGSEGQIFFTTDQDLSGAQILVNPLKQLFVLQDGDLYRANTRLESLEQHVTECGFENSSPELVCAYGGETGYYAGSENQMRLVTRSSQNISSPLLRKNIGYAFFVQSGKIIAAELDMREHQNQYILAESAGLKKIRVSPDGTRIFYLDGSKLYQKIIRQ